MPNPLHPRTIDDFTRSVDHVLVVEEKRSYVERTIKECLYGRARQPLVLGKRDLNGAELLRDFGALDASTILEPLRRVLTIRVSASRLAPAYQTVTLPLVDVTRTPYFCSGCPHNSSLRAPKDATVGGGIGCHAMARFVGPDVPVAYGMTTHMGAEGTQFLGIAPFVSTEHFIQNMGDGTYFHSGQLAVQAAIAAGTRVTFKILYNDAIAMTGGQSTSHSNARPVSDLCHILLYQGVRRIVITTEERARYRRIKLPKGVQVWDRHRIEEAQEALRQEDGVTVLIHDQRCAAENRRDRQRKVLETPLEQVVINERVCEGCGDCGVKSNCLSVEPVETSLGRKTRINSDSCNYDFLCIDGDCPSFVTVRPTREKRLARAQRKVRRPVDGIATKNPQTSLGPADINLAEPDVPTAATIRMPGIGGTGVVTASLIIGTAAMLEGRSVQGLDQTGLSQKAGPVVSDLIITPDPIVGSNKAAVAGLDLLLGFDLIASASAETQSALVPGRSTAVVSTTRSPTGAMTTDVNTSYPDTRQFEADLSGFLGHGNVHFIDAATLCESALGSAIGANIALIGVAYQLGCIPASAESLERSIVLRGVAVDTNIRAFRLGRAWAADPSSVAVPDASSGSVQLGVTPAWIQERLQALEWLDELAPRLSWLASELERYQGKSYSQRFLDVIDIVAAGAANVGEREVELVGAAADGLFKLMAYKDEYEVARLLLDPYEQARIRNRYGSSARITWNLHPPVLRALGVNRKVRLGPWFRPVLRLLAAARILRGTAWDPFGRSRVRQFERRLRDTYINALTDACTGLTASDIERTIAIARLPRTVTGYELLKLERGQQMLADLAELVTPPPSSGAKRRRAHD